MVFWTYIIDVIVRYLNRRSVLYVDLYMCQFLSNVRKAKDWIIFIADRLTVSACGSTNHCYRQVYRVGNVLYCACVSMRVMMFQVGNYKKVIFH